MSTEPRNCAWCSQLFQPRNWRARYCSTTHKNRAYEQRRHRADVEAAVAGVTARVRSDGVAVQVSSLEALADLLVYLRKRADLAGRRAEPDWRRCCEHLATVVADVLDSAGYPTQVRSS